MKKFNLSVSVCLLALSTADAFGYCTMTHMKNCGLDWGYNNTENEYVLGELDTKNNHIKTETELRTTQGTSLYDSFNNCGVLINKAYNDAKYKEKMSPFKSDNLDPAQQNGLMIYLVAYNFFKEQNSEEKQNSELSKENFSMYYNAAKELIGDLTLNETVYGDVGFYLFNEKWNAAEWMAEVKKYRSQNHEIEYLKKTSKGDVFVKDKTVYPIQNITTKITMFDANIAAVKADAIVNAANSSMTGGDGVDGAIHRAAGSNLYTEEARHPKLSGGRCPTGNAKVTSSHNLKGTTGCEIIVHTAGPTGGMNKRSELLKYSYTNSLELAEQQGARTIVFPTLSIGIFAYPVKEAAGIATETILDYVKEHPYAFDEIGLTFWEGPIFDSSRNNIRNAFTIKDKNNRDVTIKVSSKKVNGNNITNADQIRRIYETKLDINMKK